MGAKPSSSSTSSVPTSSPTSSVPSSSSTSSLLSSSSTSAVPSSSSTSSVPSSSYTPIIVPSSWGLRMFSLAEIKKATNNFDQSLLLRRGWITELYKGTYDDYDGKLRTVTIKVFKLESIWNSNFDEKWMFVKRLKAWSQFRHKHVVLVIGYCYEFAEYILVYEHTGNGNLAQHLCNKITPTSFLLSWKQCLDICIDAALGLEYLHNFVRYSNGVKFALGDVAVTNIMLDDNGVAKISNLYHEPITVLNEMPAYKFDPHIHSKNGVYYQSSDIYAFGVLLVKVLSRKVLFDREDRNLGKLIKKCIEDGTFRDQIIHPDMIVEIPPDTLTALVDIASECLNSEPEKRPDITQLVKKLQLLIVSPPQRPGNQYSLQEIKDLTNNFESIIGRGGEGIVYKGVTNTNTSIAVKRLQPNVFSEFQKEIKMLAKLDHPNLTSLVGYCDESDQKFLIYEFMSNGNLAQSLYSAANPLSWMQCLKICIGAARGLQYLHTQTTISQKGIIHRDVKPVNILLDDNFNAKISDFGLSKLVPQYQTNSEIATKIKGTIGHFAPEYIFSGKITRKIDIYAFGLVLFEVLCKKKLRDFDESVNISENEKFGQWAKESIDHVFKGWISPICLEAFVGTLVKCLNYDPKKRPTMNNVVSMLEYALKCQEAWDERHKPGQDLCIPGGVERPILYCKLNSNRSVHARIYMRRYSKFVEERDLGNELCVMELKHALGNDTDIEESQLFFHGNHVGDTNAIRELHGAGKLKKTLGLLSPFICDSCQNASACDVCSQIYWYVHCNNCGSLTVILKKWEGKLRSCLECNADLLRCAALTFSRMNRQR